MILLLGLDAVWEYYSNQLCCPFSLEEDLGMFDGVTDDDEDINDHLLMVPRSASKRSIRVQSAPIIIGDKNSKPKSSFVKKKFEPTVIKPFKMTLRYYDSVLLLY